MDTDMKPTHSVESGRDIPFEKDEDHERPEWSNRFQYILSLLGFSVGLGNLWRFPYVCQRNGGGAFLIPYAIMTIIVGMPLFYLEVCLGQLSRSGPILVWGFCPLVSGIGFSMMILNALLLPYYSQILTWGFYYLYMSFATVLPWTTCGNAWNTPQCVPVSGKWNTTENMTTINGTLTERIVILRNRTAGHGSTEEFWQYKTLSVSSGLEELGSIQPHLLLCWFLACLAVFLCLIKGVKSLGKVVYLTVLMPYLLLTVLLVKSCTMPGALNGIIFYLKPDFTQLINTQVWMEALIQLFFSLGPAWGSLIVMASHNPSTKSALSDTIIVCVCGELTSFFAGLVVFSTVGYLAHSLELPVADVITSGPGIGFIVYPEAAALLPLPQLWSALFFMTVIMMGVDSVFAYFETVVSCLGDICSRKYKSKNLPTILVGGVVVLLFLAGLVFTTSGGIYVFQLIDWYIGACTCFVISILNCVVVSWLYGIRRFSADIENMTGRRLSVLFKIVIAVFVPLILTVILVMTLSAYKPPTYGQYVYPEYAVIIGWCVALVSMLPIPVCMAVQVFKRKGDICKRLKKSVSPNAYWKKALRRYRGDNDTQPASVGNNFFFLFSTRKDN